MSYPEAFWLNMDSPAEVVMALALEDLPKPFAVFPQVRMASYRVDFAVPRSYSETLRKANESVIAGSPAVVVEVDGFTFHNTEDQFEADRRRDRDLAARRKIVLRFSAREVFADPHGCVAEVQAVLEQMQTDSMLERIGRPFIEGMVTAAGHLTWMKKVDLCGIVNRIPSVHAAVVA